MELDPPLGPGTGEHSPSITYPIAYDLAQWHESAGQEQEAVLLYGKATDAIERMVNSIEDAALQSIFLQSAPVQAIKEGLDRTR